VIPAAPARSCERPSAPRELRRHGRLALACAGAAALLGRARGAAPGRDLDALARALEGATAAGAHVDPNDLRWEPSGGDARDLLVGRRVLFLARRPGDDTRDLWRARVRVTREGSVLGVADVHDLTNTPLGDDHELVIAGTHAAFATRAYGQEQSVTVLDLAGEGGQNRSVALGDRVMAAITNAQRTGSLAGLGRLDVTLESPAAGAMLALDDEALAIVLSDGRAPRVDLTRGELASAVAGVRADPSMHLPKRFSHWTVDTLRAVSWIGPAPIAWAEDQALSLRDALRRTAFRATGASADVMATVDPPPPVLDTSQASVEEAHWPPPPIPTMWKAPEPGEGEWVPPEIGWLRKVPGVAPDGPSAFYRTFVRPDEERPYAKVLLVAMDTRQLDFDMEAGVEDPEPLTGPHGVGHIPRDPAVYRRVAAAFNGAFKTEHGHYGMMVHKRVLLPPVPGAATVVALSDGSVGFGTWGADRRVGGLAGVRDDALASFRQNLDPLVDRGQVNPTGRNLWGYTLPGKGVQTERSGLCVTMGGHLLYAWGDDVSATTLARAMKLAGCNFGMHLDMNPYHTGFLFTEIDDPPTRKFKSQLLTSEMSIPADRYVLYAPKDFFYVMVHDPRPPALSAATPWSADGGTQPPPHWLPGLWAARLDDAAGGIEVLDIEPGRATWRIRAGASDSPAATPLRELTGDEANRALLAVGTGIALEKRPRGLATDGRLAVPPHGGPESGALLVSADGRLSIARASEVQGVDAHGDMLELPIVLWEGAVQAAPAGPVVARSALGLTATGRVLLARGRVASFSLARGRVASFSALGEALAAAGCTRAVALDRGARATAFLDRAGTDSPPRGRYDESVLYAIAAPLPARAFRFESAKAR
jgi:hypothetical protein